MIVLSQKAPAPKGALRPPLDGYETSDGESVRKHRAPKGALRPNATPAAAKPAIGQKAPSAKRCIKTPVPRQDGHVFVPSESTERQKVH